MNSLLTRRHMPTIWNDFEDFFRAPVADGKFSPDIEIKKNDKEYKLIAQLPGVKKENLQVGIADGYLTIHGKYENKEEKEYDTVRSEIATYTEFHRSLKIDENSFDVDKVDAKLSDGVLEVTLPLSEKAKPKQIEVKVNG